MRRARQRRGLVVLVVLLLGLSLVAPVAAGPHDDGTMSGDSFGDSLSDSDDSTDDSTDDSSTDDGDASDTDSSSDSGSDSDSGLGSSDDDGSSDSDSGFDSSSDDESSDSDSDPDSDSDSGLSSSDDNGSSDSDSDSDPDSGFGSSSDGDSSDDESDEERVLDDGLLPGETSERLSESLSTVISDRTSGSDDTVSETSDLVDLDTTTGGTENHETELLELELLELDGTDTAVLELTTTTTMTDVATTVGTVGDSVTTTSERLTTGASDETAASTEAARFEPADRDPAPPVNGGTASVDARGPGADGDGAGTGDAAAPPRNAIGFPVSGEGLPGGPAGAGAIVGLAGTAAAIAARQSGALSGMSGSLGTTAQTAATAMPGSSHLDRLVRMLAPFRYSRYDDSDPLEHEARDAMFEVVEQSPGTYLSEIADRAELPLSTARHHIRVLEREDLVTGAKVRGKRRFYPAHTDGVELAAAMNDESTAAVIDALARLGAASVSDLADELGKDPSTVTHHVQRLEEDEVVVRERDGRAVMNKLSAAARTMLEPDETPAEGPTAGEAMASD